MQPFGATAELGGHGDHPFVQAPLQRRLHEVIPAAELVVEVTSAATAHHDRSTKAAGYAAAGVPLYLLVDQLAPDGPAVTLYGTPLGGAYRVLASVGFGSPLELPAPFRLAVSVG
ncbi:hypothetical protein GCM10023100_29920 [Actinocorallia cavernae]|uniref:Putative restriction endonuclease domain-containing protein n=2 Tax=Actinomycetes TaxID=1760 RepID=A0ABP8SL05_9ACTN